MFSSALNAARVVTAALLNYSSGRKMDTLLPKFSVVIPMLNECESLPELVRRTTLILEELSSSEGYEIAFVDDGSTDRTRMVLRNLKENNHNIPVSYTHLTLPTI